MVIYILMAFSMAVVLILVSFDKLIPNTMEDENDKKFYKQTLQVVTAVLTLSFIMFSIAEIVDVLYSSFNIIAIILIIFVIAFYFFRDYQFKHKKESK